MIRVKICGITNLADALVAAELGADALGFVFAPSPRQVEPTQVRDMIRALPPLVTAVGVFANQELEQVKEIRAFCGLDLVQLHGEEGQEYVQALGPGVIKALAVGGSPPPIQAYPDAHLLLDSKVKGMKGGSGQSFDWDLATAIAASRPVILAGGLDVKNLNRAIETVKPWAVDVSSGVEKQAGRKDHDKIAAFIALAKHGA